MSTLNIYSEKKWMAIEEVLRIIADRARETSDENYENHLLIDDNQMQWAVLQLVGVANDQSKSLI
jgi:hypothetical protein|tara:strand:- start:203 stop:397 length:195 start_codon:yes stop_codon:yes gene_type:complete